LGVAKAPSRAPALPPCPRPHARSTPSAREDRRPQTLCLPESASHACPQPCCLPSPTPKACQQGGQSLAPPLAAAPAPSLVAQSTVGSRGWPHPKSCKRFVTQRICAVVPFLQKASQPGNRKLPPRNEAASLAQEAPTRLRLIAAGRRRGLPRHGRERVARQRPRGGLPARPTAPGGVDVHLWRADVWALRGGASQGLGPLKGGGGG
jgi:hypothetical protein